MCDSLQRGGVELMIGGRGERAHSPQNVNVVDEALLNLRRQTLSVRSSIKSGGRRTAK